MSKLLLVSVVAAGCLSRFRNGMQFTDEPKQIEVTDSDLEVLQADNFLKVRVISDGADNASMVTDELVNTDVVAAVDSKRIAEPVPSQIIVDGLGDGPTITTATSAGTAAAHEPVVRETKSAPVPEAPVNHLDRVEAVTTDASAGTAVISEASERQNQGIEVPATPINHLDTIVEAMRGLNLDMTAGKPTVYDLQDRGLDISAKERDAAWDALVK